MTTTEMKGAHDLSIVTRKTIGITLHIVLDSVEERKGISPTKYNSKTRDVKRVVRQVNASENAFGQRKRSLTSEIKVSSLSHKRSKQGCPRLS